MCLEVCAGSFRGELEMVKRDPFPQNYNLSQENSRPEHSLEIRYCHKNSAARFCQDGPDAISFRPFISGDPSREVSEDTPTFMRPCNRREDSGAQKQHLAPGEAAPSLSPAALWIVLSPRPPVTTQHPSSKSNDAQQHGFNVLLFSES